MRGVSTEKRPLMATLARVGAMNIARGVAVLLAGLWGTRYLAKALEPTYPLKSWLAWTILAIVAYTALFALACVSIGRLALTKLFRVNDLPTLETGAMSFGLGVISFVLAMYVGGALHLFNGVFAIAMPVIMIAASAKSLRDYAREIAAEWAAPRRRAGYATPLAYAAIAAGIVCVAFVYLGSFTPDSINFDASWSHLPIAADYARAGKIIPFNADYTRSVPHLNSIVATWAFIVPSLSISARWMLALHLELAVFVGTLVGIAAMARWLLADPVDERPRGTWAAFFLFPAIFVYDCNIAGAADHYLALFAPLAFLGVVRVDGEFEWRRCALAGAFLAGALLTKYQAIYLIFGVGLIFAGRWIAAVIRRARRKPSIDVGAPSTERSSGTSDPTDTERSPDRPSALPVSRALVSWKQLLLGPVAILGALLAISSPHFLKNLIFYGNPVYPFAQDIFKSHPTVPNAAFLFEYLFKDYTYRLHGTTWQNIKTAAGLTLNFSVKPHYSFTKSVPNTGSLFTLTLPLILFLKRPKRLAWAGVAGMAALFLWAYTFQVDRHLQTFLPLLVACTAAVIVRAWEQGWLARIGLIPLVGLQILWGADAIAYNAGSRINGAFALIKAGYDGRRDDARMSFRQNFRDVGAALPPNAKVIEHRYRPNLGIDRDIYLDWAGSQGLFYYEDLPGPQATWKRYKDLGMTHIIHLPGHGPGMTKHEEILFQEFLYRYCPSKKRIGMFEVIEIPASSPPPDHEEIAVSIGANGYRDGLYHVMNMNAYEAMPGQFVKYPNADEALPADGPGQRAMIERADAVILGASPKMDPEARAAIDRNFTQIVSYSRNFVLYLRRSSDRPQSAPANTPVAPHSADTPESPE
jgi:hypothetical protein